MNSLVHVLQTDRQKVLDAFAQRLRRSGNAAVAAAAPRAEELLDALFALVERADPAPAAAWLRQFRRGHSPKAADAWSASLAVLAALERAVRLAVVRRAKGKKAILGLLGQLARATDALRAEAADASAALDARSDRRDADPLARGFQAVIENSRDVICLASLHGKPFYLNRVGRRLVGMNEGDEIPITSLHGYHDEEAWAMLRDVAVPEVKRTGRWDGPDRLRVAGSGETIDVDTTLLIVPDEDDKPSCLAVIHRSQGRETRYRRALEEAEARKHAILETSLDPILTVNHEGVITEFNRAAEQVFGRKREEVLGTRPSEVLFPPSKIEGHQNRIDRYLDAGEGSLLSKRTEVVAVRASGLPFEAELTMTLSQERGKPVLTFFVRDISLRKRAEEEQRRHAVELERSNRELEQFAYVASHDLQEPLRKIRTFGERLQTACGDALDETGRTCIERMKNAATRMQALINGLLTLSRVTTAAADFEPVDLNKTVREVLSDLEVKIEQSQARLDVGKLPTLQADPLQMRQLLQNLIGNALKFHAQGETPRIRVSGRYVGRHDRVLGDAPAKEQCEITVEDDGIGFDAKYLDRIFDVFQRLHPREAHEGTGVGLAICRKIAERHGGAITARSQPGQGAAFVVTLPVRQSKEV
ncbi:MAG: PAS domain S-box protein [Pirellulales bacterium]|nr:PAS domain S-box protein [Pirellulales bacterium]